MAGAAPTPSTLENFTGLARVYAECRPTYPRAAIESFLEGLTRPITVADVGCGTGISTRLLVAAGVKVIGIDPNEDMLAQARGGQSTTSSNSSIEFRQGTGEHTGLADSSVDVVVCAQSFHWFDAAAALREFHRILKPKPGRLALMWNVRDDRDPFTTEYGEIVRRAQHDAEHRGRNIGREHHGDPTIGGCFVGVRTLTFTNAQRLSLDGLIGRLRSASYFPKADNPLREELESAARKVFDRSQREGVVALQYQTEVTLADRVASAR